MALAAALAILCVATGAAQSTHADAPETVVTRPRNIANLTDPVAQLARRLSARQTSLSYDKRLGVLPSLLRELAIPLSSQTLVFSKTSLQSQFINPRTPRALYFNDSVYVGYVPDSTLLEIAAVDPRTGPVFYTVAQAPNARPRLVTNTDCVQCHAVAATAGIPGLLLRSVFPRPDGAMAFNTRSFITDHSSPFAERWGGWYVTGQFPGAAHMGNTFLRQNEDEASFVRGENAARVAATYDRERYPTPDSDVVALLVLNHQVQMHNLISRLRYAALQSQPLDGAIDAVVRYALFADEAALPAPAIGSSSFARDFERAGVRDREGRSLRQLDLKTRLLTFPASFLLYSDEFRELPIKVRTAVLVRLDAVLADTEHDESSGRLTAGDRAAARAILLDTLPIFAAQARP